MTDLERAAQALHNRDPHRMQTMWRELPAEIRARYIGDARAALEALMEPSQAMRKAAEPRCDYHTGNIKPIWQAMLRAILEQSDG